MLFRLSSVVVVVVGGGFDGLICFARRGKRADLCLILFSFFCFVLVDIFG